MSCTLDERLFVENLSHNISLFKTRFPELYSLLKFDQYDPAYFLKMIPADYEMLPALKDESFSLKVKDHYIHSKYSPII